jgi:ATP-dependent Clp protease ATP-binding subunit ClpA
MSLDLDHAELAPLAARLAPYARGLLERSGRYAAFLHADEVGVEHLLCTLMADEDCAAHRVVLHAFADPGTLSEMALATASGILVVGSRCALPFSPRGVKALFGARELAAARGETEVGPGHLLLCATRELEAQARSDLERAGFDGTGLEGSLAPTRPERAATRAGALFKHFTQDAKRALSTAGRSTQQVGQAAISPAHIAAACLVVDHDLEQRAGLSPAQARRALRTHTADPTPPPARRLAPDRVLLDFLAGLPEGAESLDLLDRCLAGLTPELAQHLVRNKVTRALLERSRGVFRDPGTD